VPTKQKLGNYFVQHFKLGGKPGLPRNTRSTTPGRQMEWAFPALSVCRSVFEKATGVTLPKKSLIGQFVNTEPTEKEDDYL
jgi:hypothetical protein